MYLLWKLPAAWFMGIRVRSCSPEQCLVMLPFTWRSQNPFRSIYFAAQCAAGELSTGLIALALLQEKPPVSMLVTHIEAVFFVKANDTLTFTCSDGAAIHAAIQKALETGNPQVLQANSIATLPDGREAAKISITWSFKKK